MNALENHDSMLWKRYALLTWALAAFAIIGTNSAINVILFGMMSMLIFPSLLFRGRHLFIALPLVILYIIPGFLGGLTGLLVDLTEPIPFFPGDRSRVLLFCMCFLSLSPFSLEKSQALSSLWFQCLAVFGFSMSIFLNVGFLISN